MAAVFTWTGQDTDGGTEVAIASDVISFYGASFNDAIEAGEYQTTTHVENDSNVDQCVTFHLMNAKYVSANNVDLNGGGSEALSGTCPTTAECTLKLNFTFDNSVATSSTTFWAYDGTTPATPPVNITFYAIEQGDTAWTNAEGSGSALAIDDDSAATSHDYFLAMSASPDVAGVLTELEYKIQLTYQ